MRDEDLTNAELAAEISRLREHLGGAGGEQPAPGSASASGGAHASRVAPHADPDPPHDRAEPRPSDWFGPGRLFEGALLINLDSRPARLARSISELERVGLAECVSRMPAFQHEHGMYGCSVSHVEAVRYARWKGWRSLLILEDDIKFSPGFVHDIALPLAALAERDWGVFQFGFLKPGGIEPVTPDLFRFRCGAGAHAIALHQRIFDFVIERYVCELDRGNWAEAGHLPFDEYVNNYPASEFEMYGSTKLLISQFPGRSDTRDEDVDYREYLEDAYAAFDPPSRPKARED